MDATVRRRKVDDTTLDLDQMKSFYRFQPDYQKSKKGRSSSDAEEKLPLWWVIPLIACIGLILGLTLKAFYKLPDPVNGTTRNNDEFSISRARKDLEEFVAIGPKVTGSAANENTTVDYLMGKLQQIEQESLGLYKIEINLQEVSGGYMDFWCTNVYQNVQNIVVRLTPKNSNYTKSLLVNSHFDTMPDSPGGGDDGSMVVVMLGVISALTKSKETVRHPVVFLFNGAEEAGLLASHGFITKHKWRREIAAFVNLDATGVGGKEILFQTGPNNPWIVDHYAKAAKYPYATVIGEEIFERDIIPSDTDYRIFRDFGNIPGLDLAYTYNDYVYHTRYDDIDLIEDGTFQHTGDNVLNIVKSLANADELEKDQQSRTTGKAIFFDVFGIFLVNYSETTGIIVNVTICIVSLVVVTISMWLMKQASDISFPKCFKQFGITIGVQLIAIILAVGLVMFLGFFVDAINYSLSWFSQPWIIFGLYFVPFIFVMIITQVLFLGWKRFDQMPLRFRITLFLHAHCLVLIVIAFVLTGLAFRTAFFFTQCVLFYTIGLLINLATKWYLRDHIWLLPILIPQAIPIAYISYIMEITYNLFIPITGRSGAANNPELIITIFAIIYSLLIFGFITPIFSIFRQIKTILVSLPVIFLIFFILIFTSVCFPYREKVSPQRQALFHTKRIMHNFDGGIRNEDSGYYAITWDRQCESTIKDVAEKLKLPVRDGGRDCGKELYCGLPVYHPYMLTVLSTGLWIDAEPPNIVTMPTVELISKVATVQDSYRYTFDLKGTKMNELIIQAATGVTLIGWSIETSNIPEFKDKEYFIHMRYGVRHGPYRFSLDLKGANTSTHAVTIGLIGHFMQDEFESTGNFKKMVSEFPEWVFVQGIETTYQSWLF